jgi:transposase
MDMRELKGLELAARARITFADGAWQVPSQSSASTKYRVTLNPVSCSCEDYQLHQKPCKHVHAARLVCARDHGGDAPAIVTDAVPKRPTYKQNWPAYNEAQKTEKHRFQALLFDLCRNLPDPPRENIRGQRPHLVRDAVFSMAFKVYSTFSGRRFTCDLADAHERGYLTKPISGHKVSSFFESADFTPILKSLIVQSSLPLRAVETTFAPDSSGFSTSRFVRWFDKKYGVERSGHDWVKAHAICGVKTNIVTAVEILGRDANDCPVFKPLVETTALNFTVKEVPADKGYLSNDNLAQVEALGGTAYVPFKSNSVAGEAGTLWEKTYFYYQFRREEFLKHYHQRSNAESTFSMVKAKFRDHVRSKTDVAMANEVFCKFLCHNICVVIQSQCELGIEATFWPEQQQPADKPDVLPLIRPG